MGRRGIFSSTAWWPPQVAATRNFQILGRNKEMKNKLIGMDFAVEVIQTVLLTGQLADEKPVSLLIIASPESGKTTAARKANLSVSSDKRGEELAVALTDTTGKGLLKVIREHPRATHVIFNDLAIVTGHKSHVINYLFSVVSALIEEGVVKTADPEGIQPYGAEGLKGIIGCITPRLVRDQRFVWNKTGLTTRMLPFFYRQGIDVQLKAEKYHAGLKDYSTGSRERTLLLPEHKMKVAVSESRKEQILELAKDLAKKLSREGRSKKDPDYEELGYRRIIQFRSLAKAHSLLTHPGEHEPRVHKVNIEFLRKLSRFVSYRKAEDLEEPSSSSDSGE